LLSWCLSSIVRVTNQVVEEWNKGGSGAVDLSNGINGVFKGGGAKGVVYAGALWAVEERGIRFAAVAGSSAGAITATLIAAGMSYAEFTLRSLDGLKSIRHRIIWGFLPWVGKSLFSVDRLEAWLEQQLQQRVASSSSDPQDAPVTFRKLFGATGVELNVVAMDLARRQPVVFNHVTAPDCNVAKAVVASCAIPVAMPAGRVVIRGSDGIERVHRIVDGGAWANYPAFVFRDPSFREFHGLGELPPTRPTIGFVINDPSTGDLPEPETPVRMETRKRSPYDLGSGRASGVVGALFNWSVPLYGALVLLPVALGGILALWLRDQVGGFFPVVRSLPNTMEPFAVALFTLLFAILVTVAVTLALFVFRLGRELFDVGLPSALAALSVGPGVPDWVGRAESDPVVRLSSPEGISTTGFKIPASVVAGAVARARVETANQLDALLGSGGAPAPAGQPIQRLAPLKAGAPGRRFLLGVALFFTLGFGPLLAIGIARSINSGQKPTGDRLGSGPWSHYPHLVRLGRAHASGDGYRYPRETEMDWSVDQGRRRLGPLRRPDVPHVHC
jgi:predicted acylesterase/phospholipase RssA